MFQDVNSIVARRKSILFHFRILWFSHTLLLVEVIYVLTYIVVWPKSWWLQDLFCSDGLFVVYWLLQIYCEQSMRLRGERTVFNIIYLLCVYVYYGELCIWICSEVLLFSFFFLNISYDWMSILVIVYCSCSVQKYIVLWFF